MVRRRQNYDPLKPITSVTWLTAKNQYGKVLECLELMASADLRAVLTAERTRRVAEGWVPDEIGRVTSSFFCTRDGERIEVGICRRDPRLSPFASQ
jgi:hypothetical protein